MTTRGERHEREPHDCRGRRRHRALAPGPDRGSLDRRHVRRLLSPEVSTMSGMLDEAWRLSPAVELRPEPFGALAYHFGNRKLTFLKRPELVRLVRGLAKHPDVRSALVAAEI